jgi:hypothetical protein
MYYTARNPIPTRSTSLTTYLRIIVRAVGPSYGLIPSDVSTKNMRASGATALLCARIDPDTIRLVGRWASDAMLRYLHVQVTPVITPFAPAMLEHGDYHFRRPTDI